MAFVAEFIGRRVSVLTTEGRHFLGTLESCDQLSNVVMSSCEERVFEDEGDGSDPTVAQHVPLGVYAIRGAHVALVGLVDTVDEAGLLACSIKGSMLPRC
mmetsp:Transcript_28540/g.32991  ORF Transcript_28540/g.32991 Transcript_28540/m.32991 type:complete len:100 (-) Transcript_28540:31-330(-)